jgi:site-specific DNA-methyltransferase (adenine-specific)
MTKISEAVLMDNMEYMAKFSDKYFELAIVDPPYNIGVNMNAGRKKSTKSKKRIVKKWDNTAPDKEYFTELFRVSQNQIVFGCNYFTNNLPISMGWIFWDKCVAAGCSFSDGELAWTSFNQSLKKAIIPWSGFIGIEGEKFHPTTKPIKLYKWILQNYAKPNDKILDTHLGSQSSRIAAYEMGFDFYGCEIDKDYFNDGNKRFENAIKQTSLFTFQEQTQNQTTLF